MLRRGLLDVTGDLLAASVKLCRPIEVADHAGGALGENECIRVSRVDSEDVTRVGGRLIRPASVQKNAGEVYA